MIFVTAVALLVAAGFYRARERRLAHERRRQLFTGNRLGHVDHWAKPGAQVRTGRHPGGLAPTPRRVSPGFAERSTSETKSAQ